MSAEDRSLNSLAEETADHLVNAYLLQDALEEHSTFEDKVDTEKADKAYDHIHTVYEREFPHKSLEETRAMAEGHMNGLFKQDVIENPPEEKTREEILDDERWETEVYPELESGADAIGIPTDWADFMTAFFRDHGQGVSGWKSSAYNARKTILEEATGQDYDILKDDYNDPAWDFVEGVEYHDDREWMKAGKLITQHYNKMFQENGILDS